MNRRRIAIAITLAAIAVAAGISIALPVTRTPAFHHYADQRAWFGIPHAGDVLSNLPFLIAGIWGVLRADSRFARLASLAVAAIGIGSGAYHVEPSDLTLAFDWGPIAIALMIVTAAVIDDRLGARAGRVALGVGLVIAIGSVIVWLATGGTGEFVSETVAIGAGTVTPYGAVQALGIALPPLIALAAPGSIPRGPLLVGVLLFALARLWAANDLQLLDAIGISGHSLKHVAAAAAAACALYALTSRATSRASRASLSSS